MPIALVDDDRPVRLADTIQRGAGGQFFLNFQTRIVQIPAMERERFRVTRNRVTLSFTPNMEGTFDRVEQVVTVALAFRELDDMAGLRTFFAFWVVEGDALSKRSAPKGRLNTSSQKQLKQRLKEIDMPEIMEWFKQEGWEAGLLEGREKGLEEGREEGREEGLEYGLRQKARETARRMLARGYSWELITDVTELKPEDLQEAL